MSAHDKVIEAMAAAIEQKLIEASPAGLYPRDFALAALAAIEAAGWVCVPREPTEGMYEARRGAVGVKANWDSMLAAAPKVTE